MAKTKLRNIHRTLPNNRHDRLESRFREINFEIYLKWFLGQSNSVKTSIKKTFFVFFLHKISKSFAKRHGESVNIRFFVLNKQKWSKEDLNNAGNFAGTIPES